MPKTPTPCCLTASNRLSCGLDLALGRVRRHDHLDDAGILLDHRLDVRAVVRREAGEPALALLPGLLQGLHHLVHFAPRCALPLCSCIVIRHRSTYSSLGLLQAFLQGPEQGVWPCGTWGCASPPGTRRSRGTCCHAGRAGPRRRS